MTPGPFVAMCLILGLVLVGAWTLATWLDVWLGTPPCDCDVCRGYDAEQAGGWGGDAA